MPRPRRMARPPGLVHARPERSEGRRELETAGGRRRAKRGGAPGRTRTCDRGLEVSDHVTSIRLSYGITSADVGVANSQAVRCDRTLRHRCLFWRRRGFRIRHIRSRTCFRWVERAGASNASALRGGTWDRTGWSLQTRRNSRAEASPIDFTEGAMPTPRYLARTSRPTLRLASGTSPTECGAAFPIDR
jgi:hypothetical protein